MNQDRREFLGTALMTIVAAKLGIPEPRSAFGPVQQIDAGVLNVGYVETGRAGAARFHISDVQDAGIDLLHRPEGAARFRYAELRGDDGHECGTQEFATVLVHVESSERERERLHARIEKLDLELAIRDRPLAWLDLVLSWPDHAQG